MASSTRKSSRVRIPKIKEDGATPVKKSKTTTPPAVPTPITTITTTTAAATAVVQPQTVVVIPTPAVPVTSVSVSVISPAIVPEPAVAAVEELELTSAESAGAQDMAGEEMAVEKVPTAVFKDPSFVHSSIGAAGSKRTRVWKNLKQIVATERSLPWQQTDVTYGSVEGPPSFKPAKKYSDLSGLEARYTDPQTKIRYASPDEFTRARTLPSDLVTGYLALRKASAPVP